MLGRPTLHPGAQNWRQTPPARMHFLN